MRFFLLPSVLALALLAPFAALAQDAQGQTADAQSEGATAPDDAAASVSSAEAGQSSGSTQQDGLLSEAELEQLVAPIALYSDPLLANVLIASTYPLEVVEAARWYEENKELKGEALEEALAKQDWDDSLKDLVTVPDALEMMNKDLDWTQKLGDAVLAQQADVMAAVQVLRARAKENGTLESNPQQTVTVTQTVIQNGDSTSSGGEASSQTTSQPQEVIAIQPTNPEKIYVPYYDPNVVYGTWPYPSYQPYYYPPPPGYRFGSALATGLAWSAGFAIGNAIWGDDINWGRNDINVNIDRNFSGNTINRNNVNAQKWEHNSEHRRGVEYNNKEVQNKFAKREGDRTNIGNNVGNNAGDRRPGDGRPGDGRPSNQRPSVGDIEAGLKNPGGRPGDNRPGDKRPGGADGRPGASNLAGGKGPADRGPGNNAGKRPSVGDIEAGLKKPGGGGGNRPAAGNVKRPEVGGGNRPGGGAAKPAAKKPSINKPAVKKPAARKPAVRKPAPKKAPSRPSGNAFNKRDAGGARKASSRGRASAGGRSISRGGGHRGGGRRR